MDSVSLSKILVTPLKQFDTTTGGVMRGLRSDDDGFFGIQEAYFAWANKDCLSDWKLHQKMTMNLVVVMGSIKFVFCQLHPERLFRVEVVGHERTVRLTVPPGIWFSYSGIGEDINMLANFSDTLHDSDEILRKSIESIPFDWKKL